MNTLQCQNEENKCVNYPMKKTNKREIAEFRYVFNYEADERNVEINNGNNAVLRIFRMK